MLHGEFDLNGVEQFDHAAAGVTPTESLVLDLRDLSFMDSSGLGALMGLYRRGVAEGWSLVVAAPQPQVTRLLQITGVDSRVTVTD